MDGVYRIVIGGAGFVALLLTEGVGVFAHFLVIQGEDHIAGGVVGSGDDVALAVHQLEGVLLGCQRLLTAQGLVRLDLCLDGSGLIAIGEDGRVTVFGVVRNGCMELTDAVINHDNRYDVVGGVIGDTAQAALLLTEGVGVLTGSLVAIQNEFHMTVVIVDCGGNDFALAVHQFEGELAFVQGSVAQHSLVGQNHGGSFLGIVAVGHGNIGGEGCAIGNSLAAHIGNQLTLAVVTDIHCQAGVNRFVIGHTAMAFPGNVLLDGVEVGTHFGIRHFKAHIAIHIIVARGHDDIASHRIAFHQIQSKLSVLQLPDTGQLLGSGQVQFGGLSGIGVDERRLGSRRAVIADQVSLHIAVGYIQKAGGLVVTDQDVDLPDAAVFGNAALIAVHLPQPVAVSTGSCEAEVGKVILPSASLVPIIST